MKIVLLYDWEINLLQIAITQKVMENFIGTSSEKVMLEELKVKLLDASRVKSK